MKASAANRRRATWPPTDPPRLNPDPGSIAQYVAENMDAVEENVRRTCSEVCSGCLGRQLERLAQAQQSVNSSREKV